MNALFRLSLSQLAGGRRLIIILLLALFPVGLSALLSSVAGDEPDFQEGFTNTLIDGMLIAAIMPIVTMTLATAAFGNELEDRTLNFLAVKPIARWRIVLPKYLAALVVALTLVLISGVISALLGFEGSGRAAIAVGAALLVGVATYAAIFTWAGLMTTRALGFALVYVFLWEGLISSFLEGVRYLSVRGYTLAILYALDKDTFAALENRVIPSLAAIIGGVAVTLIFVWLSVRRLRRMDVP